MDQYLGASAFRMKATVEPDAAELRILHLNSLLTGGGTDDQCVKLAAGLQRLGQHVSRRAGRARFATVITASACRFSTPAREARKLQFILRAARFIAAGKNPNRPRPSRARPLAGDPGGAIVRREPKIVLTRHMAKSPCSWASRRFLLGQCDALIAVSEFVARVLREGVYEPDSPEQERRVRPPLRGDHGKIQRHLRRH